MNCSSLGLYPVSAVRNCRSITEGSGRACCEFLLAKAMERGIKVGIAQGSCLLDTSEPTISKLYGYHRLSDPLVVGLENERFVAKKYSEIKDTVKDEVEYNPPEAKRT